MPLAESFIFFFLSLFPMGQLIAVLFSFLNLRGWGGWIAEAAGTRGHVGGLPPLAGGFSLEVSNLYKTPNNHGRHYRTLPRHTGDYLKGQCQKIPTFLKNLFFSQNYSSHRVTGLYTVQ